MTDYRQKAIEDVAKALDCTVGGIQEALDAKEPLLVEEAAIAYAVAQREAQLRLEDLLCDCILQLSAHEGDSDRVKEWRAALNAVKEG